jgi:hypothetical protein
MKVLIRRLATLLAHETRSSMCDCGTCCDQCGHYPGCMSLPQSR